MLPAAPGALPDAGERFLRNIWGYHFMNLALHMLAGLALFGVVRRTLLAHPLRSRFGSASTALAFVVALIWLVHPLLTDAVTYIAQRTELLMGMFFLVTLYCAIRAGEPGGPVTARRWWTAGAIAACALGMGSKQSMAGAPLMVWLWDWTFRTPAATGDNARPAAARWALYSGLAATWLILGALVAHERWPHSIGFNREGWTPWTYFLTQTSVIVHYLRLSYVPWPLALDYDGWPMARSVLDVLPYATLLAVLFCLTVWGIVRRRPWAYAGAWFFVILAPSSSLLPLPTEIAAERRMYLPLAGVVGFTVLTVYAAGQWALDRLVAASTRRLAGRVAALLLVGTVAVGCVSLTRARNRDYWSDERIWADTVQKRPTNARARLNYGVDLMQAGRAQEAEEQLRQAVRLKETNAAAHGNLGSVLCSLGRLDEGISHLERALALDPEYTDAYRNLGEAYAALGRRARAAEYFALAVGASPDNPFLLNRLGWLLATSPEEGVRNAAKAVEAGERAVRLTSRQDTMSLDTLAAAYAEAGRFQDAAATAREGFLLAERQGNVTSARELAGRAALYEAGRRYREPAS
jgi:tetratricopeptide (TPR) repeat protein